MCSPDTGGWATSQYIPSFFVIISACRLLMRLVSNFTFQRAIHYMELVGFKKRHTALFTERSVFHGH